MIALDTNILVWGVRKLQDPGRPDIVERCVKLVEGYKERKIPIMIPAPVLGEFLVGYTPEQQVEVLSLLTKEFFVGPFDAQAAMIAAQLYDKEQFNSIRDDNAVVKQCLKVDYMVVATAIRHGVSHIYADDAHFKPIAGGRILVKDIPPLRSEALVGELSAPTLADGEPKGQRRQMTLDENVEPESASDGS